MLQTPLRRPPCASLCSFTRLSRAIPRPFNLANRSYSSTIMDRWGYFVSPRELADGIDANRKTGQSRKIVPLCAAWFLPNDDQGRTGRATFEQQRIPAARFFDIDAIKDKTSPYPHMLPGPVDFEESMRGLGISNDDVIVVYDTAELGIFSAPRVAWTLKVFGHQEVHILNNFRLWVQQSFPLETGAPSDPKPTSYKVARDLRQYVSADFEFVKNVASGKRKAQILDARPGGRFTGKDPEPRPGLSSGHMPNAKSLPFSAVLHPETKAFLPAAELRELLASRDVSEEDKIVSSCGTGVSAAVIDAALAEAGIPDTLRVIYDGSWTEWAQRVRPEEGLIIKD